jgi:chromosome segregation ATPase
MNILRLKEEINNHEKKMQALKTQWNNVKEPLEVEKTTLKEQIMSNKMKINEKLEEIKRMRVDIEELNADISPKETLLAELNKEYENQSKEASKMSNRQFYTRRILEICSSIDKQRKEIDKILIETKGLQKEINNLTGKLERVFNSTDELIFKDAKKDETNKKVYKLFVSINESYDNLIKTIEDSSHLNREIRDTEDQV